jgi:hypothetical protein
MVYMIFEQDLDQSSVVTNRLNNLNQRKVDVVV